MVRNWPFLKLVKGALSWFCARQSQFFSTLLSFDGGIGRQLSIDSHWHAGFGHSSYKNPVHSLQELAQDILELMEQLDIPRYSVLGWSTGGGVALEMAALRPETIEQVFLLSSVGIQGYLSPNKSNIAQFSLLPMLIQTNRAMAKWNPALQKVELALQQKDRRLLNKIMEPLYQLHPISETDYQIYMEAMCQQRNYSDIFINLFTFNMTNRHNGILAGNNRIQLVECPLIIIHGDKDKVVRLDSALLTYQTKKKIPTSMS